ncbi:MAG: PP2C family protein-serine/threonine phosphatase, partial [Calditrichia bacterium]
LENQDSWTMYPQNGDPAAMVRKSLFVVADGMGGHESGKVASEIAIRVIRNEFLKGEKKLLSALLMESIRKANAVIFERSHQENQVKRMGTTCTALGIRDGKATIAHVGDSRVYHIYGDTIKQLTEDHTQVAELVKQGILNVEDMENHPQRSILNRALGAGNDVDVEMINEIALHPGDRFVLCSDGLVKVKPDEIKSIVRESFPIEACRKLVDLANKRGGDDNVTVIVIEIAETFDYP